MICFCHMIKTAGATVKHIFMSNYGINYIQVRQGDLLTPSQLEAALRVNSHVKAIGGHGLRSRKGLDSVVPDMQYITFLRDPVRRYISHYNYGRSLGNHDETFDQRLDQVGERDYQTKFLLGAQNYEERCYQATEEHLELAKDILRNDFGFVGLVESFDESALMMKEWIGSEDFDVRYELRNVTKVNYVKKDELSAEYLDKLTERNSIDMELYRFAKEELFEEQKARYGYVLDRLDQFRSSNRGYSFNKPRIVMNQIAKYGIYTPIFKLKG